MDKYLNDITIWLHKANHPIVHKDAKTYQKGWMFCVYEPNKQKVFRYPAHDIFRVMEGYADEQREHKE